MFKPKEVLISFFTFLFFATKIITKDITNFTEISSFGYYNLNLEKQSNFFYYFKSQTPKEDQQLTLHFFQPKNETTVVIDFCVYKNYKDYQSEKKEFDNCDQVHEISSNEETSLLHTETGKFYIVLKPKFLVKNTHLSFFIYEKKKIIEINDCNKTYIVPNRVQYYRFYRQVDEIREIEIQKNYIPGKIRIFSFVTLINSSPLEIIEKALEESPIYFDQSIEDNSKYFIQISLDNSPGEQPPQFNFKCNKITIEKLERDNYKEFNVTENTTQYFKLPISLFDSIFTENIVKVSGIDFKGNYKHSTILCDIVYNRSIETEARTLLKEFNKTSGICKADLILNNRNEAEYFLSYKPDLNLYLLGHTLIIIINIQAEEKIEKKNSIRLFSMIAKKTEYVYDPDSYFSLKDSYLQPLSFSYRFYGSIIFYPEVEGEFILFKDSISDSIRSKNYVLSKGPFVLNKYYPEQKNQFYFVSMSGNVNVFLKIIEQEQEGPLENKPLLRETDNFHIHITSCIQPHYFLFSNQDKTPKSFFYTSEGTEKVFLKKKIEIIEDKYIEVLPTEDDLIERGEIYPGEDFVVKVLCSIPVDLQIIIISNTLSDINSNGYFLLPLSGKSTKISVDYNTNKGGIFSVYHYSKTDAELSVLFDGSSYKIKNDDTLSIDNTNLQNALYELNSTRETLVKMTVSPDIELFLDLNKKIKWKSEDISEDTPLNANYLRFKLPNNDSNWTYLQINTTINGPFNVTLAYKLLFKEHFVFEPIFQDTFSWQPNSVHEIKIKNFYFEKKVPLIFELYLFLSSNDEVFRNIKMKFYHDLSVYGKPSTSFDKTTPILAPYEYINNTYILDDDITLDKQEQDLWLIYSKCQEEDQLKIKYNNLFDTDSTDEKILTDKSILEIKNVKHLQFAFIGSVIRNKELIKRKGVIFSYIFNPTNQEKNFINEYYNYIPKPIQYNREKKILSWEKLSSNFKYEIYLKNEILKESYLDNDCYILTQKGLNYTDILKISTEANEYDLNHIKEGDYFINVVAVSSSPVPLRIVYKSIFITTRGQKIIEEYPKKEKEIIPLDKPILYIILDKKPWDYIKINITDPEYQYYFSLNQASDKSFLTPTTIPGEIKKNITENDFIILSNPYNDDNSLSSSDFYYLSIKFTKDNIKSKTKKNCEISFEYINQTIQSTPIKKDSDDLIRFNNIEELKGKYYSVSVSEDEDEDITKNRDNKITFVARVSDPDVKMKLKILSSDVVLSELDLTPKLQLIEFSTLTDLIIKFESDSKQTEFFEVLIYYTSNLTTFEKEEIKEKIINIESPFYDNNERKVTWNLSYLRNYSEVYIFPYSEEYLKNSQNELYLSSIKDNLPPNVFYKGQEMMMQVFFNKTGDYVISVVSTFKELIPIRVVHPVLNYTIQKFNIVTKYFYSFLYTKDTLVIFPNKTDYDYVQIEIDDVIFPYYVSLGRAKSLEEILPIPIETGKIETSKEITFPNYNRMNNTIPNEIFYYQIQFPSVDMYLIFYARLWVSYRKYNYGNPLETKNGRTFYGIRKTNFLIDNEITSMEIKNVTLLVKNCTRQEFNVNILSGKREISANISDVYDYKIIRFLTYTQIQGYFYNSLYEPSYLMSYGENLTDDEISKIYSYPKKYHNLEELQVNGSNISWTKHDDFDEYHIYYFNSTKDYDYKRINGENITDCDLINETPIIIKENTFKIPKTSLSNLTIVVIGVIKEPVEMRFIYPILHKESKSNFILIIYLTVGGAVLIALIFPFVFLRKRKIKSNDLKISPILDGADQPINEIS